MSRLKRAAGTGNLPALIAILAITLPLVAVAPSLSADEAKGGDWQEVTLVYTSDVVGKIDPCG